MKICKVCYKPYVYRGKCKACGAVGEGEQVTSYNLPNLLLPKNLPTPSLGSNLPLYVQDYLYKRGVSKDILHQLICLHLSYKGERIFFPLYKDDKVVGYHGRLIEGYPCSPLYPYSATPPGGLKKISPPPPRYLTLGRDGTWLPGYLRTPLALFVCEGIFDALFFWPAGVAICRPVETPTKIRTLLALCPERIILVGDNDSASDLPRRRALWRRESRRIPLEFLSPPGECKDFGEALACGVQLPADSPYKGLYGLRTADPPFGGV